MAGRFQPARKKHGVSAYSVSVEGKGKGSTRLRLDFRALAFKAVAVVRKGTQEGFHQSERNFKSDG